MTARKAKELLPALSHEALFAKSKVYIGRALAAKGRAARDEYQLWASLALELLGKAVLADIHPCLIADPTHTNSLFAAAGVAAGTDVKTITAKTLFDRLTHVSKRFDKKTQKVCEDMSVRRNAELHSGETPFAANILAAWEGRFWHTTEIILETIDQTIESWLGADQAEAPKALIEIYTHAMIEAAKVKIELAREEFVALPRSQQKAAIKDRSQLSSGGPQLLFRLLSDCIWPIDCPSCESKAYLAGVKYGEEVASEQDEENWEEEVVDVFYVAEEFRCPVCGLHLDSRDEIEGVGLDIEYTGPETRQREYEPDYGND